MSKFNVTEKVQLMVLALESIKYGDWSSPLNTSIMISIMLSSDYTPFINEVKPLLREGRHNAVYILDRNLNLDQFQEFDLISGYAKQFINDNKK